ncbi:MAG: right-handed parallel beta-helix repeat-containing protein [bacterium]|nr:right-handed parallel beta-helix repeat-containing protein [bacterium]
MFRSRGWLGRLTRRRFLTGSTTLASSVFATGILGSSSDGLRSGERVNVRRLGAAGDGHADDTRVFQNAVQRAAGGGVVRVPPGVYRLGTVRLRSGITLALDAGAVLLGSPDDADYDPVDLVPSLTFADLETADFSFALLAADGCTDVTITGPGVIDAARTRRGGPKPIALRGCRRVRVADVEVRGAPNYAVSLLGCTDVVIEHVTVTGGHADGIDLDCCRRVRVAGCRVDALDDGICLKASGTGGEERFCEQVVIEDCIVESSSNGLKLGSESSTGFRDVVLRDCLVRHRPAPGFPPEIAEDGGVALEMADGGVLEDVLVEHVRIENVGTPLFVRLGDRSRAAGATAPGVLRRVTIRDLVATGARATSVVAGLDGARIEDLTLADVRLAHAPGAPAALPAAAIAQLRAAYPRPGMFGPLPAAVLWCRHVAGLRADGLVCEAAAGDPRPALWFEDVERARLPRVVAAGAPALRLHDVRDVALVGDGTAGWVHLTGRATDDVRVAGDASLLAPLGTDVPPGAVVVTRS